MANIYEIKRRIRAVKNTRQITRAMQLVAASKMKRAQSRALISRPYVVLLAEMISTLHQKHLTLNLDHPLFEAREPGGVPGLLVVGSDRGLCGGLNSNLFRQIRQTHPNTQFVAIGRKVAQFLQKTGRSLLASLSVSDQVELSELRPAVGTLLEAFYAHKIDSVSILYPQFVNTLEQKPVFMPLLPIGSLHEVVHKLYKRLGTQLEPVQEDDRELHFEPNLPQLLERIAQLYFKQEIHQIVLEAKASEHSARVVAMKKATDNAGELINRLTLAYNKQRQAMITQEILEIASATLYT